VFGVFQHLKGLQEHVSLPLAVMNLPDWPSEGVFNRSASSRMLKNSTKDVETW